MRPAVAIFALSTVQCGRLVSVLEAGGCFVTTRESGAARFADAVERTRPSVLLIDLARHGDAERRARTGEVDAVCATAERLGIPAVFNDQRLPAPGDSSGMQLAEWSRRLIRKLALASDAERVARLGNAPAYPRSSLIDTPRPRQRVESVWVLGGSIGGPPAARRFLRALPAECLAALVYVQHMGVGLAPMLAEQLQRVSTRRVRVAQDKLHLEPGEVIVVGSDQSARLEPSGRLRLLPAPQTRGVVRAIDGLMRAVADCYGARAGALVLSGIGGDGIAGSVAVRERGGSVCIQDPQTCVVSGMPLAVRDAVGECFSGTPEALAAHVSRSSALERAAMQIADRVP